MEPSESNSRSPSRSEEFPPPMAPRSLGVGHDVVPDEARPLPPPVFPPDSARRRRRIRGLEAASRGRAVGHGLPADAVYGPFDERPATPRTARDGSNRHPSDGASRVGEGAAEDSRGAGTRAGDASGFAADLADVLEAWAEELRSSGGASSLGPERASSPAVRRAATVLRSVLWGLLEGC